MRIFVFLMALAGFLPPGPFSAPAKPAAPAVAPASIEILVFRAIEALNAKDTVALSRLSADRGDFLEVYPHFTPDTSSERRDFAAGYFLSDNRKLMRRALDLSGGHRLDLARFTVAGPVQAYGKAELHRGLAIWVKKDSTDIELKLVKSAIRTRSGWKIWSYADD